MTEGAAGGAGDAGTFGNFGISGVDHVQLAAPPGSEESLRAYYVGVLGMAELTKPPVLAARGGCWFGAGDAVLHLGIEEDFRPARKAHPGIRVTGVHAFAKDLQARGAKVVWDYDLPGHSRFFSQDPVGNRLEFLERTATKGSTSGPSGGSSSGSTGG